MVVTKTKWRHLKKNKIVELEMEEKKIRAQLSLVKANKRSTKK